MKAIVVLGAGPKALALAAKAAVLGELGLQAPDVVAVERAQVAAHWSGGHGFTNGGLPLGTPPEKDVGFPYGSDVWGEELGRLIDDGMLRYSWQRYLVTQDRFADWIDRRRPQPKHAEWCAYLRWVADEAELRVCRGDVVRMEVICGRWHIEYVSRHGEQSLLVADSLIITGSSRVVGEPAVRPEGGPRYFDQLTVWPALAFFDNLAQKRIAVIGAGEACASAVCELLDRLDPSSEVVIFTSAATAYTRGENFFENRYFSDPTGWRQLTEADRREFIRRTDRGVLSQQALERIDRARNVRCVPGRVVEVSENARAIEVVSHYGERRERHAFDFVINAASRDPLWFAGLLGPAARALLTIAAGGTLTTEAIESSIDESLALQGMEPPLHLPALAAVSQGPGFPNLSCLSLVSDRILRRYVPLPYPVGGRTDAVRSVRIVGTLA